MKYLHVLLLLSLSACSTIDLHKGAYHPESLERETADVYKFHHVVAWGLVEISDPVQLQSECKGSSNMSIRTEFTPISYLIAFATSSLYTPWQVSLSCGKT